jgi:hypothetical protein
VAQSAHREGIQTEGDTQKREEIGTPKDEEKVVVPKEEGNGTPEEEETGTPKDEEAETGTQKDEERAIIIIPREARCIREENTEIATRNR